MNKRSVRSISFVFGGVMLASLLAYPLANRTAQAEEHRHPRIYKALDALRDAKQELEDSPSDFHGKKREAEEEIQRAADKLDEIKDW